MEFDPDLIIPDRSLSINEGAIAVMGWQSSTDPKSFTGSTLAALAEDYKFSLDTPFEKYPSKIQNMLLYGTDGHVVKVHYKGQRGEGVYDVPFEGIIANVKQRYRETSSETMRDEYETFMKITPCEACGGDRLKPEALAVTVGNKNIAQLTKLSIRDLKPFIDDIKLSDYQMQIGKLILKEIKARLQFCLM